MSVCRLLAGVSIAILCSAAMPVRAIIIRHDRADSRYIDLAAKYPQLVHMNTQPPGKPADGEGTLIGPKWVVTAAHIATLIKPGHRVTTSKGAREVAAVHVHPLWTDGPHDIALVELTSAVEGVAPARLYRQSAEVGAVVTVVGIGDTGHGLDGPTGNDGKVRAATNKIDVASDLWLKFAFDQGDAATDLEGIGGPGDSGGPAFLDSPEGPYLVGVGSGQSTRATGGREGVYGVTEYYTRISTHLDWLDRVMSRAADAPRALPSAHPGVLRPNQLLRRRSLPRNATAGRP